MDKHKSVKSINGKKVVDSNHSMALVIEDQDIKAGKMKDSAHCAAAQACVRLMDAISARVHLSRTYVEYPKRWLRFRTPSSLRTEIVSFDRGGKFKAGTYYLNPLSPSERPTGQRQGPPSKPKTGPKKKRAKPHHVNGVRNMSSLHNEFDVKYEWK